MTQGRLRHKASAANCVEGDDDGGGGGSGGGGSDNDDDDDNDHEAKPPPLTNNRTCKSFENVSSVIRRLSDAVMLSSIPT